MMKKMSMLLVCGVMIGCGGAKPTPSAGPDASPSSRGAQKADALTEAKPRTDLDKSRIKIAPPLDTEKVWQDLSAQREVARAYGDRKAMCEALEANGSDECGANAECTARIQPSCEECTGGKLVCIAKDSGTESASFGMETRMLQCLEMSGTTWHIYKGDPPAPTDQVYQQCLCDAPAPSIDAYVKHGDVRPNVKAGMCISEQARCEQEGGLFQPARMLGKVSTEEYAAYGLTVRYYERLRWCSVSASRPSKAKEGDVFVGLLENEACVVYRFEGYKLTAPDSMDQVPTHYQPYACEMP